jgi:MFS family permease
LIDRHGTRFLGALAGLSAGLCIIAIAFVNELWMLYCLFAISGLSGFGGPAGQLLTTVPVAKWFVLKRGRALAFATLGMPLGTAAFLPIEQSMIEAFGWREAWAISGVLVILIAVPACLLFMRKDPESLGLLPDGAKEASLGTASNSGAVGTETDDWTVADMLRNSSAWLILASTALSGLAIHGTLLYRFAFWEDVGIPSATVALGTSIDPLTVVFSGLFFGLLAERLSIRLLGLIGGVGVALSMLPLAFAADDVSLLFAHNFIWGAAMGANITVNNIIWPNYFGRKFLGAIRGIVFPLAVGTAAMSAPLYALLFAKLAEPRLVWLGAGFTFLLAGLFILAAKRPRLQVGRPASNPPVAPALIE